MVFSDGELEVTGETEQVVCVSLMSFKPVNCWGVWIPGLETPAEVGDALKLSFGSGLVSNASLDVFSSPLSPGELTWP